MTRLQDYGHQGLFGVLTPQANTTVEPELWTLLPNGWSLLNARLTSDQSTIEKRLVDYTRRFESTAQQFANAPIEALAIACTGASYLIGKQEETRIIQSMQNQFGIPCITAAQAATEALRAFGAQRIALLSPYPETLNQASGPYWQAQGFEIVDTRGPAAEADAFHPIYAMSAAGVFNTYQQLSDSGADAVLMLGTGMATLAPILQGHQQGLLPGISCNLALAWATCQRVNHNPLDCGTLQPWLSGDHWAHRLALISDSVKLDDS